LKPFGSAALFGFWMGLLWGVGCTLALLYSIYLAGYRKAVEESQEEIKSKRYLNALQKLRSRKATNQS
jgi:hypothetical protein